MKTLMAVCAAISIAGCAQQHVSETLAEAKVVEGKEYAKEMAAQSPFKTVEIRWSEAADLMESRNRSFIAARETHLAKTQAKPQVGGITAEVRSAVTSSVGDVLNPGALVESLRNPTAQLPKQFASLSRIKDISHSIETNAWADASAAVDAEFIMRRQRVRLHQLLRTGDLIDTELNHLENASPPPEDADPALGAAIAAWRTTLLDEHETWLTDVRNLFDAEYQDVRFIRDRSGLSTYRDLERPDLTDWRRWCALTRSKELVETLGKSHAESKPAVPGSSMVTTRISGMFRTEPEELEHHVRDDGAVRREVRTLIQSWRSMKRAQKAAARLEKKHQDPNFATATQVAARRKILEHRKTEIKNVGTIWLMDEQCWK